MGANERQQALYDYMLSIGSKRKTLEQICNDLSDYYKLETKTDDDTGISNSYCPQLYNDIHIINSSSNFEKIICFNKAIFYIGSEEEQKEFLKKRFKKFEKIITEYNIWKSKINKNGQIDINGNTYYSYSNNGLDKEKCIEEFISNECVFGNEFEIASYDLFQALNNKYKYMKPQDLHYYMMKHYGKNIKKNMVGVNVITIYSGIKLKGQ